jgi:hypothetical protein
LHPSTHLEHIPDMGATLLDRLNVAVASSEFGFLKFILPYLSSFLPHTMAVYGNLSPFSRGCLLRFFKK